MKRLLGLLLVMGMVGCGGGDGAPPAGEAALPATPNNPQAKVDEPSVKSAAADPSVASASVSPKTPADTAGDTTAPADDVDPVVSLKELGAQIEQADQAGATQPQPHRNHRRRAKPPEEVNQFADTLSQRHQGHRRGHPRTARGTSQLRDHEVAPPPVRVRKNHGSFPAIVPLNNPWELRAFGVTHQAPPPAPAAGAGPVAGHTLCAPASGHKACVKLVEFFTP